MGEYATYNGRQVKIGTCENMTGLTAEQAPLVQKAPNSLDPIAVAEHVRFRFPFPDEDHRTPGQPLDYDRAVEVPGTLVPADVAHSKHLPGEGCADGTARVCIVQQKVVDGLLALVGQCSDCSGRWRMETLDDAADVLAALYAAADAEPHPGRSAFLTTLALRVMDGYTNPPAWVAARTAA